VGIAILLGLYALVLALLAPRRLTGAAWTRRAPRLALAAWQAVCLAVIAASVLAGLAMAVPTARVSGDLADLLRGCVMALRAEYATPGGAAAASTGTVLALAVLARCAWSLGKTLIAARHERARHARTLAMIGTHPHPHESGVAVLQDARPAAYCVPGSRRRIVLTTAALEALEPAALRAVIAHERAHLRQRHHLALAFADALAAAFPRVRLFTVARAETRTLVELAADDAACTHADPFALAEGLLAVAAGPRAPAAALGASSEAADRIRRLIAGHSPLPRARARLGMFATGLTLTVPFAVAVTPALVAATMNYCPLALTAAQH
jgi:Zn-dependent protease with chaperone function